MGCDIHMHVEYKSGRHWYCGDYFHMNRRWKDNQATMEPQYSLVPIYDSRNYDLFSVLADVRNSYPPRKYIDDPRGLPRNACDFVKSDYESWELDAHSCSYLTLQELIDFHEEHRPTHDFGGGYILEDLINRLKQRADELNLIYDFSWGGNERAREEAYNKSANIRIVFWFDN